MAPAENDATKPDCVQVWLDGDSDKIEVGVSTRFGVKLLAPKEAAWDEMQLLVVMSVFGAGTSRQQYVTMRKGVDAEAHFDVTAKRSGELRVRVGVYQARSLDLLEEREVTVYAQENHQD